MPIQTAADSISNSAGSPYGFKNRIINGAMVIDQRNAGASGTANGYTVDRWQYYGSQSSKGTWQQNAGSVTPPTGYKYYLGFTSSSAYTVGSSDQFQLAQYIEGYNASDLGWGASGASAVTLSFWVRSSLTGTFGGALINSAGNRSYPFTYTISSANTWEYETITIAGDTSGSWNTTTGVGIQVNFSLGAGSSQSGTAGSWGSAFYASATGATSVVGTNGATFYITGVQLEKGSQSTAFDYRDYGNELRMCQRYYCKSFAPGTVPANGPNGTTITTSIGAYCGTLARPNGGPTTVDSTGHSTTASPICFPVQMRTTPTITQYGNSSGQWWYRDAGGSNTGWASFAASYWITPDRITPNFSSIINVYVFCFGVGHWVASAEL